MPFRGNPTPALALVGLAGLVLLAGGPQRVAQAGLCWLSF